MTSHTPRPARRYFRWAYYVSIPMLVYRALVINDMQCCHLTADCMQLKSFWVSPCTASCTAGVPAVVCTATFHPPPLPSPQLQTPHVRVGWLFGHLT